MVLITLKFIRPRSHCSCSSFQIVSLEFYKLALTDRGEEALKFEHIQKKEKDKEGFMSLKFVFAALWG